MARAMANLKAVIVGDWDVLKVHFLKQTAGLYERDFANTYLYMQDYGLCVELYDKAVNLAIWNTSGAETEEYARLRPSSYPDTDFLFMLFCVESKETLQNCVQLWGPEVSPHCPGVPIILVGVSHCYRPHFGIDQPPSNRCVSEEEGKEAAKKIGAYAYYECDLYKHYEVYGATLLGVTAVLNKNGYQEQGGKLYKRSTFLGGLFSRGKKSPVKPPVPDNPDKLLPVTQPMRHQGTHSFSFTTLWNNELFSDVIIHHNQMVYHAHAIILFSQCKLFTTYFNNNNESVNGSTPSVAGKLTDAVKQSTFFTSASMESESGKVHLYVNNDIPSVITEAVLSCLYSNKRTVSGIVDGVKLMAVCSELSIKVKELTENQWDLELPLNTDNLQCFLSSGEFCDVRFVVEGEKLCGHRAIVCCHCEVLSAMLSGGFAESHQKEVVMQDCSLVSFCCLLEWLYTSRCDFNPRVELSASRRAAKLSDTEMLEVIRLADQYCLTELVTVSEVQLSERIINKIQTSDTETSIASQQLQLNSQLEQLLDELVDLVSFCNNCGGKELKKWILLLIASNYGDIWDEWKTSKKASELPEDDRDFIEDKVWNKEYLSFSEKFKSLYW
ncbi:rho-related protein racA-like [Dysidea avara]|uniref:rho-related protein racA-like n=1 Tax=Dysidea avara TaxID=196820 RepID=UPI00331FAD84